MKITAEKLSKMLRSVGVTNSTRDHDIGWNNAIIQIMNMMDEPDLKSQARAFLPVNLDPHQISEIIINVSRGENLQAVKSIKEWMGIDLRSAKDIVDKFREGFSQEKSEILARDLECINFQPVK